MKVYTFEIYSYIRFNLINLILPLLKKEKEKEEKRGKEIWFIVRIKRTKVYIKGSKVTFSLSFSLSPSVTIYTHENIKPLQVEEKHDPVLVHIRRFHTQINQKKPTEFIRCCVSCERTNVTRDNLFHPTNE